MHILLIEDQVKLAKNIQEYLTQVEVESLENCARSLPFDSDSG